MGHGAFIFARHGHGATNALKRLSKSTKPARRSERALLGSAEIWGQAAGPNLFTDDRRRRRHGRRHHRGLRHQRIRRERRRH
jgi:hypothetical protein